MTWDEAIMPMSQMTGSFNFSYKMHARETQLSIGIVSDSAKYIPSSRDIEGTGVASFDGRYSIVSLLPKGAPQASVLIIDTKDKVAIQAQCPKETPISSATRATITHEGYGPWFALEIWGHWPNSGGALGSGCSIAELCRNHKIVSTTVSKGEFSITSEEASANIIARGTGTPNQLISFTISKKKGPSSMTHSFKLLPNSKGPTYLFRDGVISNGNNVDGHEALMSVTSSSLKPVAFPLREGMRVDDTNAVGSYAMQYVNGEFLKRTYDFDKHKDEQPATLANVVVLLLMIVVLVAAIYGIRKRLSRP